MDYILHPQKMYREWRERQEGKYIVRIKHPRMEIKGKTYPKKAPAPRVYETYIAFLGIPYAVPPVGRLRFRPPRRLKKHHPKLIKAYISYHPCLQYDEDKNLIGSENCLYLNVYVPKKLEQIQELLPVLVYIHGGGFVTGHNGLDVIQPDNVLQNDLVLVCINYRVGPFGFLNMGTDKCRGNAGLKDQVRALKWIRDNIENFKGDPNNVTICGHDAGATCINLHLFSPLSKGLFRRAIMMSGGIYCPWGLKSLEHLQKARQFFQNSFKVAGRETVVTMLRYMRGEDVLMTTDKMIKNWTELQPKKLMYVLGPSEEHISQRAFLPSDKPLELLMEEATPVCTIAGIARQEGYMYFSDEVRGTWKVAHYMKLVKDPECFTKFLQQNLCWSKETADRRRDELRTMYFGDEETLQQMNFTAVRTRLVTFLTDLWFHRFYDAVKIGKERPATEPLYVYQYDYLADYDKDRHPGSLLITQDGPGHGDEMYNMFDPENAIERALRNPLPQEMEATNQVVGNMCKLWANFCKDGNPIAGMDQIEWFPHSEQNPSYLSIDRQLTVKQGRLKGDSWPKLKAIISSEPVVESTAEIPPETSWSFEYRSINFGSLPNLCI